MSKVIAAASMSLDGYIAGPEESGFDQLFQWYENGEVVMPVGGRSFHMTEASAEYWRKIYENLGAVVVGRRLFDLTDGWGGHPPADRPHFVVTHSAPEEWKARETLVPFTFVTDGIESAVRQAKATAGDRWVTVNGGTIARQALNAGLLDELWISLVPVLLGGGVPFLDGIDNAPVVLDGPFETVQGDRVTHLCYRVR
jgi:dihydrofolate reductase